MSVFETVTAVAISGVAFAISPNVNAEGFSRVPVGWKLESYGATAVSLWFTSSTCANGYLAILREATVTENNRLYATVMAAKAANLEMFIYYEQRDNIYIVTSFGLV